MTLSQAETQTTNSEATPLLANDDSAPDIESASSRDRTPSPTPTWPEAFAYVSPYLRPRDRHHAILAFLALFTVLLEKVGINIMYHGIMYKLNMLREL